MAFCPAQCVSIELVANPTAGCDFNIRKFTINRIAFFNCGLEIPEPYSAANIAPLFTDGSIVVSSPLRNVTWNDPETTDVKIHDCIPDSKMLLKRTLLFEDAIALATPEIVGPPLVPANNYADYDFWKDKKKYRMLLRYGFVSCNGDFWFAENDDGSLMEGWFDIYISGQVLGGSGGTMEIKKGSIDFAGDPLNFRGPDFNLVEFDIDI